MKNKLLALKHCYVNKSCTGCPFENSVDECESLNDEATKLFKKLLEEFDIDTLAKVARKFIKEDNENEGTD